MLRRYPYNWQIDHPKLGVKEQVFYYQKKFYTVGLISYLGYSLDDILNQRIIQLSQKKTKFPRGQTKFSQKLGISWRPHPFFLTLHITFGDYIFKKCKKKVLTIF
jgi:hypothetical protein